MSKPRRTGLRYFEDRARLEKRVDAVGAVFAAKARELEPAPRRLRIVDHAVDHDPAGPNLRRHPARARQVSANDGAMKTVFGVVGDSDRVFVCVIRNRAKNGTKNFLLRNCHVVRDVHEYCRLYEITRFKSLRMSFSSDQNLGTFLDAFADVGLHAIELLLRHHRSHSDLGIRRVADRESAHGVPDGPLDRVEPLAWHEETRPCGA